MQVRDGGRLAKTQANPLPGLELPRGLAELNNANPLLANLAGLVHLVATISRNRHAGVILVQPFSATKLPSRSACSSFSPTRANLSRPHQTTCACQRGEIC